MAKAKFTRTVNPLHFEALEPKRFEDLVRQLLYDFRDWRQLEATGRSGSDDGFDVRGWELRPSVRESGEPEQDEEIDAEAEVDRLWLVQCKRESKIGPSKLRSYLQAISDVEVKQLHGLIFAACADFSKRARDEFRSWCAEKGLKEFYIWGKAELEDKLFQPRNDGLLFAYFGLSLSIRRRGDQARLRAQTTIKRKLQRVLSNKRMVLLRDAADEAYPYKSGEDFGWWIFRNPKLTFRGLECEVRRYFAYIGDDQEIWDHANTFNDIRLDSRSDPWRGIHNWNSDERSKIFALWDILPEKNKAWLEVSGVIPFSQILEVDEIGDDITTHPHVYFVPTSGRSFPFSTDLPRLAGIRGWVDEVDPKPSKRVQWFPPEFREPLPKRIVDA